MFKALYKKGGRQMELKTVLNGLEGVKAKGNVDIDISSIQTDSRKVQEGAMFVAINGFEVDGHDYIKQAIEAGAKVIVIDNIKKIKKEDISDNITIIAIPDTRIGLAKIACNFYGNP